MCLCQQMHQLPASLLFWKTGTCINQFNVSCKITLQVQAAYLGGLRVPLNMLLSMRGSSTAYGPPSITSTSKNCVSGGRSAADLPHSGVIHQSLHLAHARQRLERSCRQTAVVMLNLARPCFAACALQNNWQPLQYLASCMCHPSIRHRVQTGFTCSSYSMAPSCK